MHALTRTPWKRRASRGHATGRLGLKRLVERAPVAICLAAGSERRVVLANATCRELVSEECLVGRTLATVLPACDAALAQDSARQKLRRGQPLSVADRSLELGSAKPTDHFTWLVCPLAKPGEVPQLLLIGTAAKSFQPVQRESTLPTRGDLIAQLVHELRGPLAPMRAAITLLESCEREVLERVRAILDRQVEALSRLIQDLYELARGERAQLTLLQNRVSVDALIERAVEVALPLLQARRHALSVNVEPDLWVNGDMGRLVQVLGNLLINAAKYTNAGGKIRLDAHRAANAITFCVRDDGIGIAADFLPYVFDAFVRSNQARRREADGSGLGLSVVRAIVQQHGGTVEVHSEGADCGSEFIVKLPLGQPITRSII